MEEVDIEAKLKDLQDTVDQIKALLAWEQLKRAEARPGIPPGFVLNDSVEQDIKNQYSRFLMVRLEIHGILNNPDAFSRSSCAITVLQQRLKHVEREFQGLGLCERFIKF